MQIHDTLPGDVAGDRRGKTNNNNSQNIALVNRNQYDNVTMKFGKLACKTGK